MQDATDVLLWFRAVYPDFPLSVRERTIPTRPAPFPSRQYQRSLFDAAFTGRASLQHGYLKWFALNWLPCTAEYEVQIYIPRAPSKSGVGRGRVLPRGHEYTSVGGDRFMRADVVCLDTAVECGVTSAANLIDPLRCYAVRRTVWIPFINTPISDHWPIEIKACRAYEIRRTKVPMQLASID